MVFLIIIADMQELLVAWFGMLKSVGIFDPAVLTDPERAIHAERRDYFWFGEVVSAAALAGTFTVPRGMYLTGKNGSVLSFTIAAMIFLLLFIFLPKLPEVFGVFLGSLKARLITGTLFSNFGEEALLDRLGDAKAKGILTRKSYLKKLLRIREKLPAMVAGALDAAEIKLVAGTAVEIVPA